MPLNIQEPRAENGELKSLGRCRLRFGIAAQTVALPRRVALALGAGPGAVRITGIEPSGPASSAGLQVGDLLLSIDGVAVSGTDDLIRLLNAERIGRKMLVAFLRKDEIERTSVLGADRGH
jgi:predicted metalloprotease with PDZ domain